MIGLMVTVLVMVFVLWRFTNENKYDLSSYLHFYWDSEKGKGYYRGIRKQMSHSATSEYGHYEGNSDDRAIQSAYAELSRHKIPFVNSSDKVDFNTTYGCRGEYSGAVHVFKWAISSIELYANNKEDFVSLFRSYKGDEKWFVGKEQLKK